jgi:hypothetical protein
MSLISENTMNAKKFIVAASFLAIGGSAFAGDLLPFSEADHFTSTKTRAEVKAEVVQALRSGDVLMHGDLMPTEQFAASKQNAPQRGDARTEAAESAKNSHGTTDRPIGS